MRTRLLLVVTLAMVLLTLALPARAAGAETLHLSFNGHFADATFFSTDPSGCVSTEVFLLVTDGRSRTGTGQPEVASTALIIVSQADLCTQTELIAADGTAVLAPGQFQIDSLLTAASLTATIEVFDFVSGASFPVEVNVSWTGGSGLTSARTHTRETFPGFKLNLREDRTFRHATATGTVSDGTTNFTPEPATDAELASARSGEVLITHV
jgi:hypothetical protein